MAADQLDVLRDKLYSESDGRLAARIRERLDQVGNELDRLEIDEIPIRRSDDSVFAFTKAQVIGAIRDVIFDAMRDDMRRGHITEFMRRVRAMTDEESVRVRDER